MFLELVYQDGSVNYSIDSNQVEQDLENQEGIEFFKTKSSIFSDKIFTIWSICNIMAEGFRFIYLAFGFS